MKIKKLSLLFAFNGNFNNFVRTVIITTTDVSFCLLDFIYNCILLTSIKYNFMKPIEFPEHNAVYAKDQPEYLPLPVFKDDSPEGHCISCWELSFTERLRILFTGKLWVSLMTFNKPLTPCFFTTKKSDVLITQK